MNLYKQILSNAETDHKEILAVPADDPNCIYVDNVRKLSKAIVAGQKDQKNRLSPCTHPDLNRYPEKPRGKTSGKAKKTIEIICILTVSFYASLILLLVHIVSREC